MEALPPPTGVHLGRFAPYHRGHLAVTRAMLEQHGIDQSLVIVGSSNACIEDCPFTRPDVPFTLEERIELIRASVGGDIGERMHIIGLPDRNAVSNAIEERDIEKWWAMVRALERERGEQFLFYGGSEDDLRYLAAGGFPTKVAVDRRNDGMLPRGLSATTIRDLLARGATEELAPLLAAPVIAKTIAYYQRNMRRLVRGV